MEYLFIYLLQLLDVLACIEVIVGGILLISLATMFALFCIGYPEIMDKANTSNQIKTIKHYLKLSKLIVIVCMIFLFFTAFIPTKQTTLLMGGLYIGKKTINTVITNEKLKKVDTIINLELDKRIKELGNNKI